jgi:hypothetical protein
MKLQSDIGGREEFNIDRIPSARIHDLEDELDFLKQCRDNYQERLDKSFTLDKDS